MSYSARSVRELVVALSELVMGWERYRVALADELGITPNELIALMSLAHLGHTTPTALAERLNLTSGTVSALIGRLEAAGFVARTQSPDDGRSVILTARPAGRHAAAWVMELVDREVAASLNAGPRTNLAELGNLMSALGHKLVEAAPNVNRR